METYYILKVYSYDRVIAQTGHLNKKAFRNTKKTLKDMLKHQGIKKLSFVKEVEK